MALSKCQECGKKVSDQAWACPHCGHPVRIKNLPFLLRLNLWGYEWKSETTLWGWPLIHVALGWDLNRGRLLVARGIIAIGQFGLGVITIAQFGIGILLGLGQFMLGTVVIAQFSLGILFALGQFSFSFWYAVGQFTAGEYLSGQKGLGTGITTVP
ncbi:MAG: zinc ribbon domain-containing protein [Candidatus Krumholzibacteriota bacterium]|nr:zinc ribbon domain-containing protein [Candidatus Krumholzibacteriota bacterium]